MAKHINFTLEDATEQMLKLAAKPDERSRFINRAVRAYAAAHRPAALRKRLKLAALRDRDLAEDLAHDWRAVDRQAWQTL